MMTSAEIQPQAKFGSNDASSSSAATTTPDSAVMLSMATRAAGEQPERSSSKVSELAYRLYEERGHVDGHDVDDWLEAEAILKQEGKLAA